MTDQELAEYYIKIKADADDLKNEMRKVKNNVEKDVNKIQGEFNKFEKSGKAAFDGINPSIKELHQRVEDLSNVLRTAHKDSKAYAIAKREMEVVITQLGVTTDKTTKKTRSFREGLRTLATQFFNTAGAGSGMGTVLSTLSYSIFAGGGLLAAASAATLAFQLLTKSQNENREATINQIEKIKSLSEELENMSRRELLRQMVKNQFDIMKLEAEAQKNIENMKKQRSQTSLGGSVVIDTDPIKTLTTEQQEQLRLLKEQNTTIQALTRDRSVLKGIDAEISDLRKQQNAITQEELKSDPQKLKNLQLQIDKLENYAKVIRGINSGTGGNNRKITVGVAGDFNASSLRNLFPNGVDVGVRPRGLDVPIPNNMPQANYFEDISDQLHDELIKASDEFVGKFSEASNIANQIQSVFNITADTFAAKLIDAANTVSQILGIVNSVMQFFGGSGILAPAAHHGGNFIGTSNGVKKMASGGSFIVPPGYPNDSYPLLVESGERVSVNSAYNTGMEGRILRQIDKKLAIMNLNLVEGQLRGGQNNNAAISIHGKLEGSDIYLSNARQEKAKRRLSGTNSSLFSRAQSWKNNNVDRHLNSLNSRVTALENE